MNDNPSSAEYRGRPPEEARAGSGAAQRSARPSWKWPRMLRRGPMETAACIVIALGLLMMLQPFALVLYTWSFATTLAGTLMFVVVSKFPN